MTLMLKAIKQGQVIVGKVKHPKVGMLPTNLILFAVEGEVEDLGLELEWVQEPVVFETATDLGHKEGYVKAIKGYARTLDKELRRKLECMADSIHGSSSSYYLDVLNPDHCITLLLSKNHGVELGDRWK
ncbi:MAG: hypothetical protein ACRCVV_10250 [Shewanella sp.]